MVFAGAGKATERIAGIFDDMDVSTIAVLGGLSTVGLALATTVGGAAASALGMDLSRLDRVEALVVGAGALAFSVGAVRFLPSEFGGPLAVGGIVAIGLAGAAAVLGPIERSNTTASIKQTMEAVRLDTHGAGLSLSALTDGGRSFDAHCATCGSDPGTPQALETAPAIQGRGYRGT